MKEKVKDEFTPWVYGLITGMWFVAALWAIFK